jgi:hypothetical protein
VKSMVLNIGGTGNGKPYFKYSAKADKWLVPGEDRQDKEIERPTFAADLANIKTGWVRFREGQSPEWVMDPSLQQPAPRPGEDLRRGFVLQAFSPKYFNGVAELASSAIHLCNVIKDIYDLFVKEKDRHPGKVPVLSCTGSQPMKDRHGTNYRPIIVIINWVDRPSEWPDSHSSGSGTGSPPSPPATRPPEPRRTDPSGDEPLF